MNILKNQVLLLIRKKISIYRYYHQLVFGEYFNHFFLLKILLANIFYDQNWTECIV